MNRNKKIWELGRKTRIGLTNSRLWLQKAFNKIAMPEYSVFSVLAILTGAVVGLAAVLFHHLINFFENVFFDFLLASITPLNSRNSCGDSCASSIMTCSGYSRKKKSKSVVMKS